MKKILIIGLCLLIASLGLSCAQAVNVPNDTNNGEQTTIQNTEDITTQNNIIQTNTQNQKIKQKNIQTQDDRKIKIIKPGGKKYQHHQPTENQNHD